MTIEKEWQIFSLQCDPWRIPKNPPMKPGQTRREAWRDYWLRIVRLAEQGPVDDPCDPEWTRFAREIRSGPGWLAFLREARNLYKRGERFLDGDYSWSILFDESGGFNGR